MKIIILGSGIESLVSAYFLGRAGHQITVIESQNINNKIENDSILFQSREDIFSNIPHENIKSLLYKSRSTENIKYLSLKNKNNITNFLESEKIQLKNRKENLLHIYKNDNKFKKKIQEVQKIPEYKLQYKVLNHKELESLKLIPNNKNIIYGAILEYNSFSIDKKSFIDNLQKLCEQKYKIKFETKLEINNILTNYKKITGINTDKKVFIADKYIINLDDNNIKLLNSININIPINYKYKIKIFTNINNIENKNIKYNLSNYLNNTNCYQNGDYYQIKSYINKNNYQKIQLGSNWDSFSKMSYLNLLEIKDYKKIQYFLQKEHYIHNHLPLATKEKYNNLILNGKYRNMDCDMSFGVADMIQELI